MESDSKKKELLSLGMEAGKQLEKKLNAYLTKREDFILETIDLSDDPVESVKNLGQHIEGCKDFFSENGLESYAAVIALLQESVAELNETEELAENEHHFKAGTEDSFSLRLGKAGKRIRRGIAKTGMAIGNIFRKEPVTFQYRSRAIPFRNLVHLEFLDVVQIIRTASSKEMKLMTDLLDELTHQVLEFTPETVELDTYSSRIHSFEDALKELFSSLEKELSEFFIQKQTILEEKLSIAGTLELKNHKLSMEKVEDKQEQQSKLLSEEFSPWKELLDAEFKRINTAYEFLSIQCRIDEKRSEVSELISGTESGVKDAHQSLEKVISEANEEVGKSARISVSRIRSIGKKLKAEVGEIVDEKLKTALLEIVQEKIISKELDQFAIEITELSAKASEQTVLVQTGEQDGFIPKFTVKEIEWRTFIKRMLGEYLASPLLPQKIQPEKKYEQLAEGYEEVLQIIDTSFTVIDEMTSEDEEAPTEVVCSGLERAMLKVEELGSLTVTKNGEVTELIDKQADALGDKISDFLQNQEAGELKWLDTQLKVKQSTGGWRTRLKVLWAKLIDRITIWSRFVVQKYRTYRDLISSWFGLSDHDQQAGHSTTLAAFLYETDKKIESLPFVYRRLFDFRREVEDSFLIHNPVQVDKCEKALELWKTGFPSAISVIGEKGSGKTTFIRHLSKNLFEEEKQHLVGFDTTAWKPEDLVRSVAKQLKLNETTTVNELIEKVKKRRSGSVIIIENIQNTFLRTITGYEGIKTLMYLISATKKEVLWVVSASRYAWEFLDVALKVSDYFTHSIKADGLSEQEIRELILRRQKASGYQLWFNADETTQKSRSYQKLLDDEEAAQEYLKERYFEKLAKMADGNASVAMIFWIRSIKEYDDTHFTIEPFDFSSTERLEGFDANALFAMSAFIRHDTLTISELAMILHINTVEAEMVISRLLSRGLLLSTGDFYRLNDLIYRQVVRLLKTKNILH